MAQLIEKLRTQKQLDDEQRRRLVELQQQDSGRSALDGLRFSLRSVWGRFDGSHDSNVPRKNRHVVTVDWFRFEFHTAYAFDANWEIETVIPFDIKRQRARYELPDGSSFDNPEGDIHHRDETQYGLGDFQQWGRWTAYGVLHDSVSVTFGAGFTVPVGRTEADPYEAGDKGKKHRHIQFGTGTVDPLASVALNVNHAWWGVTASIGGTWPLYRNSHGYRGAPSGEAALNFRAQITPWLGAYTGLFGIAQGRAFWGSEFDPNTGYTSAGVRFGVNLIPTGEFWVSPSASYIFDNRTPYGSETFRSDWIVSLTLSFLFGGSTPSWSLIEI